MRITFASTKNGEMEQRVEFTKTDINSLLTASQLCAQLGAHMHDEKTISCGLELQNVVATYVRPSREDVQHVADSL
jgi:hypothetical protein